MSLLKDEKIINQRTMKIQKDNLKLLAEICKGVFINGKCDEEKLKNKLQFDSNQQNNSKHEPNHNKCEGCNSDTRTEKRICRCMYYYNTSKKKLCDVGECKFYTRWKNKGDVEIIEYEWPSEYVVKSVGGIDLIIKDKDNDIYGAEVKPFYSDETVSRMVAEILTNTIGTKYKPAIMVFDDSKQKKMIDALRSEKNPDLIEIEKHINVFDITRESKGNITEFVIEKY